jgi:ferredoxin--NADP+ reductase
MPRGTVPSSSTEPIPVRVASQRRLSPSARLLSLDWQPAFIPGQMIGLHTKRERPMRLYSIASPPNYPTLDILYTVVEGGELTPTLDLLGSGDALWASEPRGEFIDRGRPAWWIANGTGIAPFLSMARSGIQKDRSLIHGARTPEDMYFAAEMNAFDDLEYLPCLSRPESMAGGAENLAELAYPGRLTRWLTEQIDRGKLSADDRRWYYLCGSEQMILQVRQMLLSAGVGIDRVISEIYF